MFKINNYYLGPVENLNDFRTQNHKLPQQLRFQQARPIPDFDRELAQLIESNKPLNYAQQVVPAQLGQLYAQGQQQITAYKQHQQQQLIHDQRLVGNNGDGNYIRQRPSLSQAQSGIQSQCKK